MPKRAGEEAACVVCFTEAGLGPHRCGLCTEGAWHVCQSCEAKLAKRRRCPVCRSDYAREPAAWEALPRDSKTLVINTQPSQQELAQIAAEFPQLENLTIEDEERFDRHGADEDVDLALDFAPDGVAFPALRELTLSAVSVRALRLTESTCPNLRSLSLSTLEGAVEVFDIALPQLEHFEAEHVMMAGRKLGEFGLFLSRCPRLETVTSYKLRGLGQQNFAVTPRLRTLVLHRAEGLEQLHLVHAPVLTELSVQAAYSLDDLRVDHVPEMTAGNVEELVTGLEAALLEAQAVAHSEEEVWRSGRKGTREARKLRWVERDEELDLEDEFHQEMLCEHLHTLCAAEFAKRRQALLRDHSIAVPSDHPPSLPECHVNLANASLSSTSVQRLRRCPRFRPTLPSGVEAGQMGFASFVHPNAALGMHMDDEDDEDDEEDEDWHGHGGTDSDCDSSEEDSGEEDEGVDGEDSDSEDDEDDEGEEGEGEGEEGDDDEPGADDPFGERKLQRERETSGGGGLTCIVS